MDPGPKDPRTRDPKTQLVVLHFAFMTASNATCVNVLSSNVHLYHCESQNPHCYTHKRRSSHQIVLFHIICLLPLSFLHSKSSLLYSAMQLMSYDVHVIPSTMLQPQIIYNLWTICICKGGKILAWHLKFFCTMISTPNVCPQALVSMSYNNKNLLTSQVSVPF